MDILQKMLPDMKKEWNPSNYKIYQNIKDGSGITFSPVKLQTIFVLNYLKKRSMHLFVTLLILKN